MKLSKLKVGQSARVQTMHNSPKTKMRLNNIGLTEGVKVTYIRKAPLSDPIEIKVRNFYLALRKNEADNIMVELE